MSGNAFWRRGCVNKALLAIKMGCWLGLARKFMTVQPKEVALNSLKAGSCISIRIVGDW